MPVFVFSFRRSKAKVVSSSCRTEDQPRRLQRHIATPLGEPWIDKTWRYSWAGDLSPNMVVSWSKYMTSTVPKRWVNTGLKIFKTINNYMVIVPSIFTLLELSVMGLVCVRWFFLDIRFTILLCGHITIWGEKTWWLPITSKSGSKSASSRICCRLFAGLSWLSRWWNFKYLGPNFQFWPSYFSDGLASSTTKQFVSGWWKTIFLPEKLGDPVDASDLWAWMRGKRWQQKMLLFIFEVIRTNCDLKLSRISAFTHWASG